MTQDRDKLAIEEIREARRRISARFDYVAERLVARYIKLQERDAEHPMHPPKTAKPTDAVPSFL